MAKRFNSWPSGPRKPLAKGLFKTRGPKAHPSKKSLAALSEAYSGQPRKNGQG